MQVRVLFILLLALVAVGCGGGEDTADSSTDVDQLLQDTFSGSKPIQSGKLSLALGLESDGGQGPVTAKLSGPFQSEGKGRLPQLDLQGSFEGGGESLSGGVTATKDAGYVSFGGNTYEIAGPVFEQFKAGYEQSAKEASGESKDPSLASLGIDPRRWLTNAKNEGEAKVGDTDTIKLTGDVDLSKALDDVNTALQKLRSLGGAQAANLPQQLTEADKKQAEDAVKNLSVQIYTGKGDTILRRMVIAMKLAAQNQTADVKLDFQILDLNQGQDISAPANPKPFNDLMSKLNGLGLGGLGGTGSGSSSGSGSSGSSGNTQNLEKYSQCIQDAKGDNSKIAKCADLLTTP